MRRHGRIDQGQRDIVDGLRQMGYSVLSLADIGHGCPDLLVASRTALFLMDVKRAIGPNGGKSGHGRELTPDQVRWFGRWHGPSIHVVCSLDEALAVVGHGVQTDDEREREEAFDWLDKSGTRFNRDAPLAVCIAHVVGELRAAREMLAVRERGENAAHSQQKG